jgi:hypothetical protein
MNEVIGLLAQGASFLVGLVISILVGMVLASVLDGPGGLLIATVIAGAGLLGSAVLSQVLRDRIQQGEDRSA